MAFNVIFAWYPTEKTNFIEQKNQYNNSEGIFPARTIL
jgi:hypothetical protein